MSPRATLISRDYFPNWCQIGPFRFNRLRRFSQLTQPPRTPRGPFPIGASDKTWGRRPGQVAPRCVSIRLILLAISRLGGEMLLLSPARATRSALLTIGTKQTCRGEFAHVRFRSEADKPRASGARRSDENDPADISQVEPALQRSPVHVLSFG